MLHYRRFLDRSNSIDMMMEQRPRAESEEEDSSLSTRPPTQQEGATLRPLDLTSIEGTESGGASGGAGVGASGASPQASGHTPQLQTALGRAVSSKSTTCI